MSNDSNHRPPMLGAIMADHDPPGPEYAFVQCIGDDFTCPATERVEGSSGLSDEHITELLAKRGWSVGPTLCPKHQAAPLPDSDTDQIDLAADERDAAELACEHGFTGTLLNFLDWLEDAFVCGSLRRSHALDRLTGETVLRIELSTGGFSSDEHLLDRIWHSVYPRMAWISLHVGGLYIYEFNQSHWPNEPDTHVEWLSPEPSENEQDHSTMTDDVVHNDPYPEHTKLIAVQEQSQAIGEFLDNLGERGLILCDYDEDNLRGRHMATLRGIPDLLAEFFGIDQTALEQEKRRMLAALETKAQP